MIDLWGEAARGVAAVNGVLLGRLAEGAVRRLEGQVLELTVDGRPVTALLEEIRLHGRRARVVLREVDWDGLPVERLTAVASSVGIDPVPVPRVVLKDVELAGRSPQRDLVAWLDERMPDWQLRVDDEGHVEACRRDGSGRVSVSGEPDVADHRVCLRLRTLRVGRLRVRAPRRAGLSRTVALPALPLDMSIVEARFRPPVVDFRATIPSLRL